MGATYPDGSPIIMLEGDIAESIEAIQKEHLRAEAIKIAKFIEKCAIKDSNTREYKHINKLINRIKVNARIITRKHIQNGTLIPQPCEACGSTEDIEPHHYDYNKPLDITWLCSQHHRGLHIYLRNAAWEKRWTGHANNHIKENK